MQIRIELKIKLSIYFLDVHMHLFNINMFVTCDTYRDKVETSSFFRNCLKLCLYKIKLQKLIRTNIRSIEYLEKVTLEKSLKLSKFLMPKI